MKVKKCGIQYYTYVKKEKITGKIKILGTFTDVFES